ncbi:MAG: EutN/CcmL family microcompartment protein [Synergistaceae bacterium]|jgi:ethanolamine utilization protein EutN|nr:EutN/CcmL family microcompartment protein [Synergistaceae bacterium]
MIICKVVGHVWSTKKEEGLVGMKLMVVGELDDAGCVTGNPFVAADVVGSGVGETVLVVEGSSARIAAGGNDVPVDCTIVGIIDTVEVEREKKGNRG